MYLKPSFGRTGSYCKLFGDLFEFLFSEFLESQKAMHVLSLMFAVFQKLESKLFYLVFPPPYYILPVVLAILNKVMPNTGISFSTNDGTAFAIFYKLSSAFLKHPL